jgi:hypothetical protein
MAQHNSIVLTRKLVTKWVSLETKTNHKNVKINYDQFKYKSLVCLINLTSLNRFFFTNLFVELLHSKKNLVKLYWKFYDQK